VIVRVWGARGSLSAPGPATVGYGGNTSCVEVELADGTILILDAGSGIRELGQRLLEREHGTVYICLTHLHLDHVEGLGFFSPLWRARPAACRPITPVALDPTVGHLGSRCCEAATSPRPSGASPTARRTSCHSAGTPGAIGRD